MEISSNSGNVVKTGVLMNDILKDHLSTQDLLKKRNLPFNTREEFLQALEKVLNKNPKLFKKAKKGLETNDSEETTVKKAKKTKKNKTTSKPEISLKDLEEKREVLSSDISETKEKLAISTSILEVRQKSLEECQEVLVKAKTAFDKAKAEKKVASKDVETSTKKLDQLEAELKATEEEIDRIKNSTIYLVAPGFNGEIPEFGTFISTIPNERISDMKIEEVLSDFEIEPDFKEMLKSGYDSGQEYMKCISFIGLVMQYTYNEINHTVLVSDERICSLLKDYVGGDYHS